MSVFFRNVAITALLFSSNAAMALDAARPIQPVVGTGSLVQITFSLLLVLVAIVALAWLLRRMNLVQQGGGSLLKVIGSIAIGQRERVVLIEVNDTWLLVGVGPGQIRTLHTMEKSADWTATQPTDADNKFGRLLTSILKQRPSNRNSDAA